MKSRILKRLILKNSRGSVLVLVSLLLIFFIGIAALAIDIGFLSTTRNELQDVADAAALAGAGYLGAEYEKLASSQQGGHTFSKYNVAIVVQAIAERNKAAGLDITIINDTEDIKIGMWDPATKTINPETLTGPDAVYVKARRDSKLNPDSSKAASHPNSPISTFFAGIFKIFGADFETLPVTAEAVAALSGPSTVAEGELKTPFGLSDNVFLYPGAYCSDKISFSPADSCAQWHNFEDDINASDEDTKLYSFIEADDSCKYCERPDLNLPSGDFLLNGPDWLSTNFNITQTLDPNATTGSTSAGVEFDFSGGSIGKLLTGPVLYSDYNGNTGTVIKQTPPPPPVVAASSINKPSSMIALFDYFRYRDGDAQYNAPDGVTYDKDDVWTATIPIYKDDTAQDDSLPGPECKQLPGRQEIVGFASIKVLAPNAPPAIDLDVYVDCDFKVVKGRGGGGTYGNIKGTIPSLVK